MLPKRFKSRDLLWSFTLATLALVAPLSGCGAVSEGDDSAQLSQALRDPTCDDRPCLPTTVLGVRQLREESELDDVESEAMNGFAIGDGYYFWMSAGQIQRVPASSGLTGQVDRGAGIPGRFAALGYNHFGDGELYQSRLYVPLTAENGAPPVVTVFDTELNLISWGRLRQGGGGWVAVNPVDGRLYTSEPFRTLKVYELNNLVPSSVPPTSTSGDLGFVGRHTLQFLTQRSESWWADAWSQGGAFSPNGVFYYVLDHASEDDSSSTGVHVFDVTPLPSDVHASANGVEGSPAPQVFVSGVSGEGILPFSYDPVQHVVWVPVSRGDELEGITVYPGSDGRMHVLLQTLSNEADDDDVSMFEWTLNEPQRRTNAAPAPAGHLTVWRPSNGTWYVLDRATGASRTLHWGEPGDIPVAADHDGDGTTDFAIWRPSTGTWWIVDSSTGGTRAIQWGLPGDVPAPAFTTSAGAGNLAVWRPSQGMWYVLDTKTGNVQTRNWGVAGDIPVPGRFAVAQSGIFLMPQVGFGVWRPSSGQWFVNDVTTGATFDRQWGESSDVPVPADYNGDGVTDFAVWRPSTGAWHIINSNFYAAPNGGAESEVLWGLAGDVPVPGQYDSDARADVAVFRPSTGTWLIINSSNDSVTSQQWGAPGDIPVPYTVSAPQPPVQIN